MLAGIAVGAWGGGRVADHIDPHRLIGPVIALGGVLAFFTVPIVRFLGDSADAGGGSVITLACSAFFRSIADRPVAAGGLDLLAGPPARIA